MSAPSPASLRRLRSSRGFTLLELMIVIAIMIALAVMALPSMRAFIPRYRLNAAAKDLAGAVQQARMMAIAHSREYRICMLTKDASAATSAPAASVGEYALSAYDDDGSCTGSGCWDVLPTDAVGDTTRTEGSYVLTPGSPNSVVGISIVGWTPMGGPGSDNTDCIVFSSKGWISNPTTDFDGGFIYVQFRNKYVNPQEDIRTVRISRGGGVTILHGAEGTI